VTQFAVNHHGVRTSPLVTWRRTLAPPRLAAPPPPSRGGRGSMGDTQQARRSSTPPPAHFSSPRLHASPSPRVDGSRPGMLQELYPCPPASPFAGVAGWARRLEGTHQLPGSRTVSNPAPSWASIVRDGARANTKPAVSRQDFLALYERCINSGLRTHIVFRHQDGSHEISISCRLCMPPVDAHAPADARRRRGRRKCAPVAAAASPPACSGSIRPYNAVPSDFYSA
jgi:hypothetical protein